MANNKLFEGILRHRLGPYYDCDVLHETMCQTKGTSKLVLYSFILEHNGHVVGLDDSERPLGEGQVDNRKFRFRGVLKIANPDWLSEFGLKIVETELNLRAKEVAVREGRTRVPQLTLEDLFSERGPLRRSNDATWRKEQETKLVILIQGEKNMQATFMAAGSRVPNGMLWNSKAHNRNYQVATMDVETYSRSQNFFWQWRLFALMKKICDRYPYIPEKKRTPGWFVEKYIADFACPLEDKRQRLIFDEEDSDVDETGKTETPRQLLRPHMSEILGLFAAQAGWLITNSVQGRQRLFDIPTWKRFKKEARKQRKEAARQRVRWGHPEGTGEDEESPSCESSEDEDERLVRENPVTGKDNRTVVRKIQLARTKHDQKTKLSISSDSDDGAGMPGGKDYASDFSEPSDVEEDDSDHWHAEEEAVNQIPWRLRLPPLLPDVDGRWWCALEECDYHIDLHALTEEQERGIPEELAKYILQKQWRNAAYDENVLKGFKHMVTNHYVKHFEERGVKAERREGRTRFTFIDGRRRRHGDGEPIRGPMPARGTLGGESRVIPTVHASQVIHVR